MEHMGEVGREGGGLDGGAGRRVDALALAVGDDGRGLEVSEAGQLREDSVRRLIPDEGLACFVDGDAKTQSGECRYSLRCCGNIAESVTGCEGGVVERLRCGFPTRRGDSGHRG